MQMNVRRHLPFGKNGTILGTICWDRGYFRKLYFSIMELGVNGINAF